MARTNRAKCSERLWMWDWLLSITVCRSDVEVWDVTLQEEPVVIETSARCEGRAKRTVSGVCVCVWLLPVNNLKVTGLIFWGVFYKNHNPWSLTCFEKTTGATLASRVLLFGSFVLFFFFSSTARLKIAPVHSKINKIMFGAKYDDSFRLYSQIQSICKLTVV